MTPFPESFFVVLVYTCIGLTAFGALALLVLLVRDWKNGTLW